jgi:hypothetical protein
VTGGSPRRADAGRILPRGVHLPQQIEAIAFQNKALLYDMLFKATAQTYLAHDRRRFEAPGR